MSPRFALLLTLTLGLPATAYELRRDTHGDLVKWGPRVEFVIDGELAIQLEDAHAEAAVKQAVAVLDEGSPDCAVTARVGKHLAVGYVSGGPNQNDIFVLEDWPYDEKALAATVITINAVTNQIVDADIVFNAQDHHFRVVDQLPPGDSDAADTDDVQNTITHELGHALGLMHNELDERVVMFPSAAPLETSKRVLAADDLAGLAALYAGAVAPELPLEEIFPGFGCSSAGTGSSAAALLAGALLLLARRRRLVLVAATLAPALVLAAEPAERDAPDLRAARQVVVAQVASRTTLALPQAPGLLFTEVVLTVRECLKGDCAATVVVRLPGGRVGDLEQVVAHQPVPRVGEAVVLVQSGARPTVLRLADPVHQGRLLRAFALARVPVPVSISTHASGSPLPEAPQGPAVAP